MSFTNLVFGNWFGHLSSSSGVDPVLNIARKDNAYISQRQEAKPWLLVDTIFYLTSIVESQHLSKEAHKQLIKLHLLTPEGEVNLSPFDEKDFSRKLMSKLAIIPQIKIKFIVVFLFWWAEETQRLKKLFDEAAELEGILKKNPTAASAQGIPATAHLDQIRTRIALLPSERFNEEGTEQIAHPDEEPPAYRR